MWINRSVEKYLSSFSSTPKCTQIVKKKKALHQWQWDSYGKKGPKSFDFFFIKFWLVFQLQRWLSWRWCYNIFGRASFTGIVEPDNAVKYPALPPLTRQHGNVTVLILQEFQKFSTFIFRIAMIEFSFFTFF